jgi:predicted nucleic acid-binding protein
MDRVAPYSHLFFRYPRHYICAVTTVELLVGANTQAQKREFASLADKYYRLGRVVTPLYQDYALLGDILQRLKYLPNPPDVNQRSIVFDVLIALGAKQINATVLTENRKDFLLIKEGMRRDLDFKLVIIQRTTGTLEEIN